jgi:Membrane-associated lipoprotein involved in thiamine biosynthesis
MGTTYTIKTIGIGVAQRQIEQVLSKVNQTFSTWDPNSELSLLNRKPINQWIDVSSELFFVLSQSQKLHQQTHGFFDPGIGRLIDAWGFGSVKVDHKPSRAQVSKLLPLSGIQYLQLKNGKVKKTKNIYINLSAIAKGFGVDQVARLLSEHWVNNFLVEIGGEVIARGKNGDKEWTLGIEQPDGGTPISIKLNNQAIATSGNYRNYFVWEGEPYMHILDPSSGLPARSDLASVSVLHKQAMLSDAYATAMMAMGSKKAVDLARQLNLSVVLILNKHFDFKVVKINP